MKKLFLILGVLVLLIGGSLIKADSSGISYCCEKTVVENGGSGGAWCVNAEEEKCDTRFKKAPTSCESTSYCKKGCCFDSKEGTCMENTPEKICQDSGGIWSDNAQCDVAQCNLGCCRVGDQAAFVTQTRCKRLSLLYGVEINFLTNFGNEFECIASVSSDEKGACVFEEEYEKTCRFITQRECNEIRDSSANSTLVSFHKDLLCSAEELGTNCGPSEKTTCVDGRDEVFFLDSCGNLANIYDSSKIKDQNYWREIIDVTESCGYEDSNANSATCGNCDYFLGSTCKQYKRTEDKVSPNYGNYICRDLSCEWDGKIYQHGETWCGVNQIGAKVEVQDNLKTFLANAPGARYFRMVCYAGEVSVEPCSEFRQEVCIETEINGFKASACKVNRYTDCVQQDEEDDCENTDKRDCKWIGENYPIACVPKYTPGSDFWNSDGGTEETCSTATTDCVVTCTEKLTGDTECESEPDGCGDENGLTEEWKTKMQTMCSSLGDCSSKDKSTKNFWGILGYKEDGNE